MLSAREAYDGVEHCLQSRARPQISDTLGDTRPSDKGRPFRLSLVSLCASSHVPYPEALTNRRRRAMDTLDGPGERCHG